MPKLSDSQFFAIQRLEETLETAKKKRIPVEKVRLLDDARACIRIALGELDKPWEESERRAHLNLMSEFAEFMDKKEKEHGCSKLGQNCRCRKKV